MVRNLIFSTSLVASFDTQSAEKDVPQVNMIMRGISDFSCSSGNQEGMAFVILIKTRDCNS